MLTELAKQHITHGRCPVTARLFIFGEVRTFFCRLLRLLWRLRRMGPGGLVDCRLFPQISEPLGVFSPDKKTSLFLPKTEFLSDNSHFCDIPRLTRDSVFILPIPHFHSWSWHLWGDYMTPLMHRSPLFLATPQETNATLCGAGNTIKRCKLFSCAGTEPFRLSTSPVSFALVTELEIYFSSCYSSTPRLWNSVRCIAQQAQTQV